MADTPRVALVVHGHFYQPPRENPWTDEVPREPSAAPHHDWNARISAECYRANAYARIYGAERRIEAIVNNYERLSFNFGPTLARWIERHDPATEAKLRAGDAEQRRRLGHGGAMAQVWGHPITPLLSARDRRTQILWGMHDFRRRFGRDAEGMWLPETAADGRTLEALIDAGIEYTIVAPEQIAAVREPGKGWTTVETDTVDTGRAYVWRHGDGSGRAITLVVFNGPFSRALAFGNATRDAHAFVAQIKDAATKSQVKGKRLVVAASDGELYGHHKTFADLTLAYAAWRVAAEQEVEVTNLGAYLAENPAEWEAELRPGPDGEGTAWSCAHGVGRWRRHCGCAMNPGAGWSQAWRGPLRDALDLLRDRAAAFYEDEAGALFRDPWAARDAYGAVVDAPRRERTKFLRALGPRVRAGDEPLLRAQTLLEMQRATFLMYASCGWFFDDVAGLESALVLRQAAHVLDLWKQLGGRPPTNAFLEVLSRARSNQQHLGTGADVFRRVSRDRVTPARAVAHAAFALLAPPEGAPAEVPGFDVTLAVDAPKPVHKLSGKARVVHARTGEEIDVAFTVKYDGQAKYECRVGHERVTLEDLDDAAAQPYRLRALARLAAGEPTVTTGRAALTVGEALGPLTTDDADRVRATFGDLLNRFLAALTPENADAEAWELVAELLDAAGLPGKSADAHRTEELVWEKLAAYRQARRTPPKMLRLLAERLGFGDAPAEVHRPQVSDRAGE